VKCWYLVRTKIWLPGTAADLPGTQNCEKEFCYRYFGLTNLKKLCGCSTKTNNQPVKKTTIFSKNPEFAIRVPYFYAKKYYGTRKCDDTQTDTQTEVLLLFYVRYLVVYEYIPVFGFGSLEIYGNPKRGTR
jgi:hypothetical protein